MNPRNNQNTTESEFSKRTPESERRTTMKKLMSVAALLLVALAAVAVSVAVVATMREIKEATESMPVVSLPEKPEAPEEPLIWRIYTNEEYGFKIGYVGTKEEFSAVPKGFVVYFDLPAAKKASFSVSPEVGLLVDVEQPAGKQSGHPVVDVRPYGEVTINSIQFEKVYWFGYSPGSEIFTRGIEVSTQHNGHLYRISLGYPIWRQEEFEVMRDGKLVRIDAREFAQEGWLESLLNEEDEVISAFNQMLESFEFTK